METILLELEILPETFAIAQLSPTETIPAWISASPFYSISKTSEELSIVCEQDLIPKEIKTERDWRCFKVKGPLDFGLTGILASLANPLAEKGVSIFAVSTFDTDYLLVKKKDFEKAASALTQVGHKITVSKYFKASFSPLKLRRLLHLMSKRARLNRDGYFG